MVNYVVLTVSFNGYTRSVDECMILEEKLYNELSEDLDEVLSNVTWGDFDGKHGHVEGDYYKEIITGSELFSWNKDEYEVDGFSRCWDHITDYHGNDGVFMTKLYDSMSNVISDIKSNINYIDIRIILNGSNVNTTKEEVLEKIKNLLESEGHIFEEIK